MDAVIAGQPQAARKNQVPGAGQLVNAAQFHELLVSHRRLVRADRREDRLRGLHDLDTGEVFLIDERRLFETRHPQHAD